MKSRSRTVVGAFSVVVIFAVVGVLAVLPAVFLRVGLDALGGRLGLWVGDPNSNDGEEYFAWPLGLFGLAVLLAVAIGLLTVIKKHLHLGRWALPTGLAISALVVGLTMINFLPPVWHWA